MDKHKNQKLIVVESIGSISELGGISGPILNPCWVDLHTINLMLNRHRRVYEVNPNNVKERVALNLMNLRGQNFAAPVKKEKAHVAPVKPATPAKPSKKKEELDNDTDMVVHPVTAPVKETPKETGDFIQK